MAPWIPTILAVSSLISTLDVQPGFSDKTIARVKDNLILSANKR